VTYNGVALTQDGNVNLGFNLSVWHLDSFTAGSFNVVVNITATQCAAIAIPLQGANLSQAPILGTGATSSSAAASCAVTGGVAGDLQLAQCMVVSTTMSTTGTNQTVVPSSPTMPILAINSAYSFSADDIAGANAGNFSWSLTSGTWAAQGLLIKQAVASGGPSGVWGGSEGLIGGAVSRGIVGNANAQGLWDGVEGLR